MSKHHDPEAIPGLNESKILTDLCFNEQVWIWSLRMRIRGLKYFEKVKNQFDMTLPAPANIVATAAVNQLIKSINYYGKKSISLNCICVPTLSNDENNLIELYRVINNDPKGLTKKKLSSFVTEEGEEDLSHSITCFILAINMRSNKGTTKECSEESTNLLEKSFHETKSTMVH